MFSTSRPKTVLSCNQENIAAFSPVQQHIYNSNDKEVNSIVALQKDSSLLKQ